jgi:hypothetical protein
MSSGNGRETNLCFAPLERREPFERGAFYKHLAPKWGEGQQASVALQT